MDAAYIAATERRKTSEQADRDKRQLSLAEQKGEKDADTTVALVRWWQTRALIQETLEILAAYGYPGCYPRTVVVGYVTKTTWYQRRYTARQEKKIGIWWLDSIQYWHETRGWCHIELGSDGNIYERNYRPQPAVFDCKGRQWGRAHHLIGEREITRPEDLDKIDAELRKIQVNAKDEKPPVYWT